MISYRPWGSTEDGRIEFESLTDETLKGALDVIRKGFFPYESVCTAVELNSEPGASEELEKLCLGAARDGVSVVAVDIVTNEVVGVAFNKIQVLNNSEKSYFEQFSDNCRCKSSKYLIDFMIDVDSKKNLFEHYGVDCILEIMFLAILPTYRKRRLGELLVASSMEVGRELKNGKKDVKIPITVDGLRELTNAEVVPSLISAIMTSNYSLKIAMKLRFNQLLQVSYEDYEFNGKKFSERINREHRFCTLVAKRIASTSK
ncbi:uncharacterized protein LOC109857557 isoform X2 [Pseudomyrmex gracilis]|nr:uncharacterized protein LOC109857557 isoform X2 [Pseudomyrmex gracilis]XP_020289580.1 uncharacterized protein LOC109857557 isoform X2 [Pseudomyrmex gracilis]